MSKVKYVPINGGKFSIVDRGDYDWIMSMGKWSAPSNYPLITIQHPNPTRKNQKTQLLMHRAILNPPSHLVVDHIDFDTFDNTRSNLRAITSGQNSSHRRKKTYTTEKTYIGKNLEFHRKRLKLSQDTVCKSVNISLRSYWGYENGKREPTIAVAKRLADLFGVTLDELTRETT